MRALSPHAGYSLQLIEGVEQVVVDARGHATSIVNSKPVVADFSRSGILDHEAKLALEELNFSGLPEGVNPLTRVGVFDTEVYAQKFPEAERGKMQAKIEARLREMQKDYPTAYIIVETPTAPLPWATYDTDSIEDVLKLQERIKVDPETVRRYEVENLNRSAIVTAMTALEHKHAKQPEQEIVVAA